MHTTEKWNNRWSRRKFLNKVGQAGGAAALYETMVALGLLNLPSKWHGIPKLERNQGDGKSVLILGAGIGGLTAAYILSQAGYRCQILEANHRAGGRNHTARRGSTVIEESDAHGSTLQECQFDDKLYLNLGPGRLPYHHRRVLGYCQELRVELEPYIMNTTGNLFQSTRDFEKPVVYREIQNDTQGYIAEMLAKSVNKGALNEELNNSDKENLLSLLKQFGPLSDDYSYPGSTRDGCGTDPFGNPTPNVFYDCEVPKKTPLNQLLDSRFWQSSFYDPIEFEWQPTLFQPVGGMDMIVEGFLRKVGDQIIYNAPAVDIRLHEDRVHVKYLEGSNEKTITADYCISNIPCPILTDIPNNFSRTFSHAVASTKFSDSCKVGWQCNTRFWESSKYEIYGGISWTDDIIEQIWYPSNGYFGQKGTLTGAYIHQENAAIFGNYSLVRRLHVAKEGGARIHEEFMDDSIVPTDLGLSIAWQHVPHLKGAWPSWSSSDAQNRNYRRLLLPDKRFYVVGDQASTLPGWQEGAMMSAEHVVELIAGIKPHFVPENIEAPNTIKVTQGHG